MALAVTAPGPRLYFSNAIALREFPWLEEELGPLTDVHRKVVTILDVVRIEQYVHSGLYGDPGRPPANRQSIARAFVAKGTARVTKRHGLVT